MYDVRTGTVYHPTELRQEFQSNSEQTQRVVTRSRSERQGLPSRQQRSGSRSGVGTTPMIESMTGLGVREELNRMNNSGSNAAGIRARQGARSLETQHNQQLDSAMDDLGL